MRKPVSLPSFEYYLSKLSDNDETLVTVLKGHLVVEALLVEIIQLEFSKNNDFLSEKPWRWSFPQKVNWCIKNGYLTANKGDALKDFNNVRNDFTHILGYQLTFDRVLNLADKFGNDEFSDIKLSKEWYEINDVIIEILNIIFCDLALVLSEKGGADYMSE